MAATPPPRLNDWQLATHNPLWMRLSTKQRIFVSAFVCSNGDVKWAVGKAYPKAKKSSLSAMAWELLKSPRVRAVLDLYDGRESHENLVTLVRDQLSHAEAGSVAAQRLLAQLERLTIKQYESENSAPSAGSDATPVPSGPGDRPRYAVGDIVEQGGHRFRIEAAELADGEVDK